MRETSSESARLLLSVGVFAFCILIIGVSRGENKSQEGCGDEDALSLQGLWGCDRTSRVRPPGCGQDGMSGADCGRQQTLET